MSDVQFGRIDGHRAVEHDGDSRDTFRRAQVAQCVQNGLCPAYGKDRNENGSTASDRASDDVGEGCFDVDRLMVAVAVRRLGDNVVGRGKRLGWQHDVVVRSTDVPGKEHASTCAVVVDCHEHGCRTEDVSGATERDVASGCDVRRMVQTDDLHRVEGALRITGREQGECRRVPRRPLLVCVAGLFFLQMCRVG